MEFNVQMKGLDLALSTDSLSTIKEGKKLLVQIQDTNNLHIKQLVLIKLKNYKVNCVNSYTHVSL